MAPEQMIRLAPAGPRCATTMRGPCSCLALVVGGHVLAGCSPKMVVGEWVCPDPQRSADAGDGSADSGSTLLGWTTSFEDGFCDYAAPTGFCYAPAPASYTLVSSPVHSGQYAAAFSITTADDAGLAYQSRCVRQGAMPNAAYYGAWYNIPTQPTSSQIWNLFHFAGGTAASQHGLWDVTLVNGANHALQAQLWDFLHNTERKPTAPPPVAVGSWVHFEFYWKRASDNSGEVALYQDGQVVLRLTGLATDDSDWGQWYVGNLALDITPPESTVYVDDVTIRSTL